MYTLKIIRDIFGEYNVIVFYSNPIGDKVMVPFQKLVKERNP